MYNVLGVIMKNLRVIAIIPARGGSKRVPHKNMQPLAGKPLVVHSVEHALAASTVDAVYVSTEDPGIAEVSRAAGARVVERPESISTDTATSESALLHVLDTVTESGRNDPDLVVFLQCTSPVRKKDDIDNAVRTLVEEGADSLFSVCKNDRLVWRYVEDEWRSLNYDYRNRKREQEFPVEYRENGSIYVFKPWVLRELDNRLGGRITVYEMDYWCSFQVDRPAHLKLMKWIVDSGLAD